LLLRTGQTSKTVGGQRGGRTGKRNWKKKERVPRLDWGNIFGSTGKKRIDWLGSDGGRKGRNQAFGGEKKNKSRAGGTEAREETKYVLFQNGARGAPKATDERKGGGPGNQRGE